MDASFQDRDWRQTDPWIFFFFLFLGRWRWKEEAWEGVVRHRMVELNGCTTSRVDDHPYFQLNFSILYFISYASSPHIHDVWVYIEYIDKAVGILCIDVSPLVLTSSHYIWSQILFTTECSECNRLSSLLEHVEHTEEQKIWECPTFFYLLSCQHAQQGDMGTLGAFSGYYSLT